MDPSKLNTQTPSLHEFWQCSTQAQKNKLEEYARLRAIAAMWAKMEKPQPGPQSEYFTNEADIIIYGGSAGGGKTWSLLTDAAQYCNIPDYRGIIFRRTSPQITNSGALWDAADKIYRTLDAEPFIGKLAWRFPGGAIVTFRHLQLEQNKYDHLGAEYAFIGFDELPLFTESQFFYLISRNRSTCGIRPKVRATTNPSPGWVKNLIAAWVEKDHPNPAKSGEVRYFVRVQGKISWVDADYRLERKDLGDVSGIEDAIVEEMLKPKSITFIRSSVYDNKIFLSRDPHYLANLRSLPLVEQKRLLDGDWDIFEGAFYAEYREHKHTCPPATDKDGRPANLSKLGWNFHGGLDWGFGNPFAFVLRAVDRYGTRHVIESVALAGLNNETQAAKVCEILARWGVAKEKCKISADQNMWSQKTDNAVKCIPDIAAFKKAGLRVVKSGGRKLHHWNQIRSLLHADGAEIDPRRPAFVIWDGYNDELCQRFPEWQYIEGTENMQDEDDHLSDALGYSCDVDPGIPAQVKPKRTQAHLPFALQTDEKPRPKE